MRAKPMGRGMELELGDFGFSVSRSHIKNTFSDFGSFSSFFAQIKISHVHRIRAFLILC
jgi:hypothetical protein